MAALPETSRNRPCRNLRNYFKEYCNSSSIHGIRYFGERRTYFERGWWLIVFLLCLSCCAYFITMVYKKWENTPVIVSFSTREKPIYEIPFPTVTICPESKAMNDQFSFSKVVSKLLHNKSVTDHEYQYASYMSLLCDMNITRLLNRYKHNTTLNNYLYSDEFFEFFLNVTPPISLKNCKWMKRSYKCSDLFEFVLTDEGVCTTFNMLDHSRIYKDPFYVYDFNTIKEKKPLQNITWTLDGGYTPNDYMHTFPRRALFSGAKNALTVWIEEITDNTDNVCKLSLQGYKITIHTPIRVPRPSQEYFRLPLNEVVLGAVQPVMLTTSDSVKVFKPEKRECYFQNEKPLKYFKVYTQRNCQLECLTNFTLEWCDCVSFFMPKENGTYICGSLNRPCMEEAEEIFQTGHLSNILGIKRKKKNSTDEFIENVPDCVCLPSCTDLKYEIQTSVTSWNATNIEASIFPNNSKMREYFAKNRYSVSGLVIYFKNNQFVTSKRHEVYGPTDFLGNFGGLLGLFTGFSILSLMEIIYFLTVRIICNIKLHGNWSGSEKDLEKN